MFLLVGKVDVAHRWPFINHRAIIEAREKKVKVVNVYECELILLIECTRESNLKVIRILKSEVE